MLNCFIVFIYFGWMSTGTDHSILYLPSLRHSQELIKVLGEHPNHWIPSKEHSSDIFYTWGYGASVKCRPDTIQENEDMIHVLSKDYWSVCYNQ
jgi:hypothetical protein